MAGAFPFGAPGQIVRMNFTIQMAREEIRSMVRWQDFPKLEPADIELLIRKSKRQDVNRNYPDPHEAWEPNKTYNLNDYITSNPRNYVLFKCIQAGISGPTQPTWPVFTQSQGNVDVTDNTVIWETAGSAPWTPTWNLAYGIAQGWKMKMGAAVGAYDITVGGQMMKRDQLFQHCKEMQQQWARRAGCWDQIYLQGSLRDRRLFQNITNQNDELFIDGQIQWNLLDEYYALRGFTGVSAGGQWIDP